MNGRITISLAALAANYNQLADTSGSRVAGVVKANAYGLGLGPVAACLAHNGCVDFFVATATEGTQLRRILPDHTIYVLGGVDKASREIYQHDQLTPVLNTATQIDCWRGNQQPAALHIDSGMQRLGLAVTEVDDALDRMEFDVSLIMSHFARADEQDATAAHQQVQTFNNAIGSLRRRFPQAEISLCNSAAAMAGGVGDDLVRGGVALYGGNPFSTAPNPMQPVVRLEGRILQLRDAAKGSPVGYGGSHICAHAMRLATVGVGYADGVPRLLSDRGEVLVQGQRCPIVGRVSMDMLHADVSLLGQVQEGEWAEVIGPTLGVDEVAQHAQTLGYEILNHLDGAQRLDWVYSRNHL